MKRFGRSLLVLLPLAASAAAEPLSRADGVAAALER